MKVFKFSSLLALVGLAAVLQSAQAQPNLDNMFLDEDTDSFDPGLPVGDAFPEIRAIYDGNEINSIETFFGDKGAVFLAMRSVDW
ncbi:MAG: hypothetical protein ACR2QQ_00640 [Gammaproteobacteria bacterium]